MQYGNMLIVLYLFICHASSSKDELVDLLGNLGQTPESVFPSLPVWLDLSLYSFSTLLSGNFPEGTLKGVLTAQNMNPFTDMTTYFQENSMMFVCAYQSEPRSSGSKLDDVCQGLIEQFRLKADSKEECLTVLRRVNYITRKFKVGKLTQAILSKYFKFATASDLATVARFIFSFSGPLLLRDQTASEFRIYILNMKHIYDELTNSYSEMARTGWAALKILLGSEKAIDDLMSHPLIEKADEILHKLIAIGVENRVKVLKTNIELMCGKTSIHICLSAKVDLDDLSTDGLLKLATTINSRYSDHKTHVQLNNNYFSKVSTLLEILENFNKLGWRNHRDAYGETAIVAGITIAVQTTIRYVLYGNGFSRLLEEIGFPISAMLPKPPPALLTALSLLESTTDDLSLSHVKKGPMAQLHEKRYTLRTIFQNKKLRDFIAFITRDRCESTRESLENIEEGATGISKIPVHCRHLKDQGLLHVSEYKLCDQLTTPFLNNLKKITRLLNNLIKQLFGFGTLSEFSIIVNYLRYFGVPTIIENASVLNDYCAKIGCLSIREMIKSAAILFFFRFDHKIKYTEAFKLSKDLFNQIFKKSENQQDKILKQRLF